MPALCRYASVCGMAKAAILGKFWPAFPAVLVASSGRTVCQFWLGVSVSGGCQLWTAVSASPGRQILQCSLPVLNVVSASSGRQVLAVLRPVLGALSASSGRVFLPVLGAISGLHLPALAGCTCNFVCQFWNCQFCTDAPGRLFCLFWLVVLAFSLLEERASEETLQVLVMACPNRPSTSWAAWSRTRLPGEATARLLCLLCNYASALRGIHARGVFHAQIL